MCGIAGFVDWEGRDPDALEAALDRMDAVIAPRGPDGAGREVVRSGRVTAGLAHRRLAILDRSGAARQPMVAADGQTWLVYNGEIYNFRELQPRVRDAGIRLRSTSDTEVLLELIAHEGLDALGRLRGMFAFALWDGRRHRLTLARDRFGIKPLVWAAPAPGLVLFGSSPQTLAASGLVSLRPAPGRQAAFLAHGSVPAGRSFWDGIHVVPPGAAVTFQDGVPVVTPYWSTDRHWAESRGESDPATVAAAVREAVEGSVRAHLVSDVPVAVFLSGGMDSAMVASAAARGSGQTLQSITVTMPSASLDERAAAQAAARRMGLAHTSVPVEAVDRDTVLDAFFNAMVQPTVDGLNTFVVAGAARAAGVRVALSGMGGDELLGGYPSFVEVPRAAHVLRRYGGLLRAAAPVPEHWPSARTSKAVMMARARPASLSQVWWQYRGVWPQPDAERLAGESLIDEGQGDAGPGAAFDIIRRLEWREFLERQLLPDTDAFTMCHALELRTPLVDHLVVDAVAAAGRWPRGEAPSWKAALLAQWPDAAVADARLRPKQGFVLPMEDWLRDALTAARPRVWRDVADRLLQPRYASAISAFLAGRAHWTRLWAVYVLDRLLEKPQ